MSLSTVTKTLANSAILFTLGTSIASASFYDKLLGTSSSFVIDQLKDQIPGLTWEKVEANNKGELEFTNLHFISQSYGYNPAVNQELVKAGKADNIISGSIPDLLEITIPHALINIKLTCLVTENKVCIDKLVADTAKITIGFGDRKRKDFFHPQDLNNIDIKDVLPTAGSKYKFKGIPQNLNLELSNFSIKEWYILGGENIGLGQLAINNKIIAKLQEDPEADLDGLVFRPTVAQSYLEDIVHPSIYNGYIADPYYIRANNFKLDSLKIQNKEVYLNGLNADQVEVIVSDDTSRSTFRDYYNLIYANSNSKDCGSLCNLEDLNKAYSSTNSFANILRKYFQLGKGISKSFSKIEQSLTEQQKALPAVKKLLDTTADYRARAARGEKIPNETAALLEFLPADEEDQLLEVDSAKDLKAKFDKHATLYQKPLKDYIRITDRKFFNSEVKNVNLSNISLFVIRGSSDDYIEALRDLAESGEDSLVGELPKYYPQASESIPYYYPPLYVNPDYLLETIEKEIQLSQVNIDSTSTDKELNLNFLVRGDIESDLKLLLNNKGTIDGRFNITGSMFDSSEEYTYQHTGLNLKLEVNGNLEEKVFITTNVGLLEQEYVVDDETEEEMLEHETHYNLASIMNLELDKAYWPVYGESIDYSTIVRNSGESLDFISKNVLAGPLNDLKLSTDTYLYNENLGTDLQHIYAEFNSKPEVNNRKYFTVSASLSRINNGEAVAGQILTDVERLIQSDSAPITKNTPKGAKGLKVLSPLVKETLNRYYIYDHFFNHTVPSISEQKSLNLNLSLSFGDTIDFTGKLTKGDLDSYLELQNYFSLLPYSKEGEDNLYLVYTSQNDWSILYNPISISNEKVEAKALLLDSFTGFDLTE